MKKIAISLFFLLTLNNIVLSENLNISKAKKTFKKCGTKSSSFSLFDLSQNKSLIEVNSNSKLKPASTLKLLTAYLVLDRFGPDYKFETKFYSYKEGRNNYLIVRGSGDPSVTEKTLWEIVHVLKRRYKGKFNKIVLDDSAFKGNLASEGQKAYQAGSSALSINYNSLLLEVCPTSVNKRADIFIEPSEIEAKFNGSIKTQGGYKNKFYVDNTSEDFSFKVRGYVGSKSSCTSYYRSVKEPIKYFGLLLAHYLQYLDLADGIKIEKKKISSFPKSKLNEIYTHKSKELSSIVKSLNIYSNNMIAEQLLMLLGKDGEKYNRSFALRYIKNSLLRDDFSDNSFEIHDASGLSHKNKITSKVLINTLNKAYYNLNIFPEYLSSLPVGGVSGTLKSRFKKNIFRKKNISIRAKTGSLNGVTSLAGYLAKDNRFFSFSFMQNKSKSKFDANRCEERVIEVLIN